MEMWTSKPFIHGIIYGSARLVRCEDPLAEESKRLRTLLCVSGRAWGLRAHLLQMINRRARRKTVAAAEMVEVFEGILLCDFASSSKNIVCFANS